MDDGIKISIIEPKKLGKETRNRFAWKVYNQAHVNVFNGITFFDFYKTVIDSPSHCAKIFIYTKNKHIIAYAAVQIFEMDTKHLSCYVAMAEIAMAQKIKDSSIYHPAYQVMREIITFSIKNWHRKSTFVVDTLVSPFIYKKCCNMLYQIYPREKQDIPLNYRELLTAVIDKFEWNIELRKGYMIRHLQWKLNSDYFNSKIKQENHDKAFNYYLDILPDCTRGSGLVTIIPLSAKNIILSTIKTLWLYFRYKMG